MSDERANYRGIWGSHPPTNYGVKATQEESMIPSKDSPSAERERREACECYDALVAWFNTPEGFREFGNNGDHWGWSPAQTAIEAMKELIKARAALSPPSPDTSGDRGGWRPTHRHYKGGLYRVIARAQHTETREMLTIYDDERGNIWARPSAVFDEYIMEVGPRFRALTEPPR
jgi:hypothetical protein